MCPGPAAQYGDKFVDESTTSSIVLELADPLPDTGYTVYQDYRYVCPDHCWWYVKEEGTALGEWY
jgi:hypothetical protein